MIRALITGSLYGEPQSRTSQSGKPYATAKLKADAKNGESTWCSIVAFGEQADRLLTLSANAAVAVSGKAELRAYIDKQGEPAAGLSVVVDELATLKGKPRPKESSDRSRAPTPRPQEPVAAGFDDDLPDVWS